MGDTTDRFGLSKLGPGDSIANDGFKFSDADIELIDRLLQVATENHRHTGETVSNADPVAPPSVTLHATGGTIPAGTRCFYRYCLVDAMGFETASSPIAYVDTPPPIKEPAAPTLNFATTGGTLPPGQYGYILSAYKGATTLETKATKPAVITVIGSTSTNSIDLILPALPSGADGFNIYRRGPGSPQYQLLASSAGGTYTDDGSVGVDCDRMLPNQNLTNGQNAVTITFPGATPTILPGFTWKIFRTFYATNWNNTVLEHLVPIGATPVVPLSFDDVGQSTAVGAPPLVSKRIGSPPRINLTDGSEVQGFLPPGRNIVAHVVTFTVPGPVTAATGTFTWTCEFTQADIIHVRPYLGAGSTPASTDVIVDVNLYDPNEVSPSWSTIYTTSGNRPRIEVGDEVGAPTVPDIVHLTEGCMLSLDVDQDGGGATPTDHDLSVNILMLVQYGDENSSYQWGDA